MHTVHFPKDYAAGKLMRVVHHEDKERWEDVADVQGTVTIPDNERLILTVDNTYDLSLLDVLHPDDVFHLDLWKLFELRDEELRHVGRLTGLRALAMLYAVRITDVGIAHLAGLVHLEMLDLDTTAVTGAGLVHLQGLQNLHTLNLWDTQVGDGGLQHLRSLVRLEDLNLRNTRISDQAVADLAALTNLRRLDLAETRITAGAVASLREALPECAIIAPL